MNKNTIIDAIICVVLAIVIIFEIKIGFDMLQDKWTYDIKQIGNLAKESGISIGLIDTTFAWPEIENPDQYGDVIAIDENRYRINGTLTDDAMDQPGYVYYADLVDQSSKVLEYEEVIDENKVADFHNALTEYFNGTGEALIHLLPITTEPANITAYQQSFTDGVIPIFYDSSVSRYFMFLDCITSYYILSCEDVFIVTDAKVSVSYANAADDPLREHAWSTYEAGAIDNTRQQLMDKDQQLDAYTQSDLQQSWTDSSGSEYTGRDTVANNATMYLTEADDDARALIVSYGTKTFDESGRAEDGSVIDISSTTAMSSQWLLTQTQYSFTDNGITINGLSGKRTSSSFEISGNASNTVSYSRPWVLCVKFMGEENKLLGLKVVDNRSNPIPADGVSYFTVNMDSSDNVDFSQIVAIQFMVH